MGTIIKGLRGRRAEVTVNGTKQGDDNVYLWVDDKGNGKGIPMTPAQAKLLSVALDVAASDAISAGAKK